MGIIKNNIVEHLDRNGGRRLEENLFIVRYYIEEMYWRGGGGREVVHGSNRFLKRRLTVWEG